MSVASEEYLACAFSSCCLRYVALHRVGPSRKLWTPDENMGMWKHDMWEQLQKEETEARATAYDWNKGRQGALRLGSRRVCDIDIQGLGFGGWSSSSLCMHTHSKNPIVGLNSCGAGRRGGFSGDGRRGRGANWVPRGLRGGR